MLMVLTLHTYMTKEFGFVFSQTGYLFESFIRSLCIVAVNVFILISGWFGIKPSAKGFVNFTFQCIYFLTICLTAGAFLIESMSVTTIVKKLFCVGDWWFVRCYIGLYIISPILNAFTEKATKRQLAMTLIFLYLIQTLWGWCNLIQDVNKGYSVFSFACLYLLARFIRLHCRRPKTFVAPLICYLLASAVNFAIYINSSGWLYIHSMDYCNPLIVMGAVGLLLVFSQIKIATDKTINRLSLSAFAAYLFHMCYGIRHLYLQTRDLIYQNLQGFECFLAITALIITFYIAAIILDQPRILLWRRYGEKITSACSRATEWIVTRIINLV